MDTEHAEYVNYLQDRFFRTGIYTHLFVQMLDGEEPTGASTLHVKWIFSFQDLGSTHVLTRDPAVICVDPDTGNILVDNVPHADIASAEQAIFGGHYSNYMRELYEFEGINTV